MSTAPILCVIASLLGFTVDEIPVPAQDSIAFFVPIDADRDEDLCLVTRDTAYLCASASGWALRAIALPEGLAVIDAYDLDGDGRAEFIGVRNREVIRIDVPPLGESSAPQVLFSADNTYKTAEDGLPQSTPLAVERSGKTCIALPQGDSLVFFDLKGTVIASLNPSTTSDMRTSLGDPFRATAITPPVLAPPGGLEFQINRSAQFMIVPTSASTNPIRAYRPPPLTQVIESVGNPPAQWPSIPLQIKADNLDATAGTSRALLCVAFNPAPETLVCIQTQRTAVGLQTTLENVIGPVRHYPGQVLLTPELPDINGDGLTDLLLWKAPLPGRSLDALTRAVAERTWPLYLTMHRFRSDLNRFEARTMNHLSLDLPVTWFLDPQAGTPLRNVVLTDMDANNTTDIALSLSETTFGLWLMPGNASALEIDHRAPLARPVLSQRISGSGVGVLLLQTEEASWLVHPGTL